MQVVVDAGTMGAVPYRYSVDDVRDGVLHRTLLRCGWARNIETMGDMRAWADECGGVTLEPDYETSAHLRGTLLAATAPVSLASPLRGRRLWVAAIIVMPVLVEVIDRLNLIPGF